MGCWICPSGRLVPTSTEKLKELIRAASLPCLPADNFMFPEDLPPMNVVVMDGISNILNDI